MIRVRDLDVCIGEKKVLSAIRCDFERPGAVVVGPAGCGKTTLLKALCGLAPFEGVIEIEGRRLPTDAPGLRQVQQRFGFVFQNDALFDDRSAVANVVFPLTQRGVRLAEAREAARSALASVGLGQAESSLPEQLS